MKMRLMALSLVALTTGGVAYADDIMFERSGVTLSGIQSSLNGASAKTGIVGSLDGEIFNRRTDSALKGFDLGEGTLEYKTLGDGKLQLRGSVMSGVAKPHGISPYGAVELSTHMRDNHSVVGEPTSFLDGGGQLGVSLIVSNFAARIGGRYAHSIFNTGDMGKNAATKSLVAAINSKLIYLNAEAGEVKADTGEYKFKKAALKIMGGPQDWLAGAQMGIVGSVNDRRGKPSTYDGYGNYSGPGVESHERTYTLGISVLAK